MLPVPELSGCIDSLKAEIIRLEAEKNKIISSCQHEWDDFMGKYVSASSPSGPWNWEQHWAEFFDRSHNKNMPAWVRTCKKCGHSQSTSKTKIQGSVLRYELPDFDGLM